MSNVFTLDDLNKSLDAKYAPFIFQAGKEKFELRQVLRLPKTARDQVKALIDSLDSDDKTEVTEEVMLEKLSAVMRLVCTKGDRLLQLLDDDLVAIGALFEAWVDGTKAGEASPLPA